MNKLYNYFHTLKYLKGKQFYFRLYYFLRKRVRKLTSYSYRYSIESSSSDLYLQESIEYPVSFFKEEDQYTFEFLNLKHDFVQNIDWNFIGYGKLWAYNINYFDFLHQSDFEEEDGLDLMHKFIDNIQENREGMEPFPIALRGINWVKFLVKYQIHDKKINDSLFAQYKILADNLEYHLLGNHLLENGFSLLFGAYYFNDDLLYKKAYTILTEELDEQILNDGAHFELTPMYHQIMLYRVLECYNLVVNNTMYQKELKELLEEKAVLMLNWLNSITYKNGDIPHFNDSTNGIAPATSQLNEYAKKLYIEYHQKKLLSDSGYRKFDKKHYEFVIDVGNIGPDYIPGHAHSDTFNFELYIDKTPFIIDTGISTYETDQRRLTERSTKAHNTVQIKNYEQSEVWSSFRVAKRAKITLLDETDYKVAAEHNGYEKYGVKHRREFIANDDYIQINDLLIGEKKHDSFSYIHFHPSVGEIKINKNKVLTKYADLIFGNVEKIELSEYDFAYGFNKRKKAKMLIIQFQEIVNLRISIKNKTI